MKKRKKKIRRGLGGGGGGKPEEGKNNQKVGWEGEEEGNRSMDSRNHTQKQQ
jgi:hypothetical protein